MRSNVNAGWRAIVVCLALLASTTVLTWSTASSAHAVPGCQNNGVYVLWARGSGSSLVGAEAVKFQEHFQKALTATAVGPYAWAELGNLDESREAGRFPDEPNEYPAVPVNDWYAINIPTGAYNNSVKVGTDELVASLNQRYAGNNCATETLVLGGYSQGADVIGRALERTGAGALSAEARRHIGFVAMYGDPKLDNQSCPKPMWSRGTSPCGSGGIGIPRTPYVPSYLLGRMASWCDVGDGVCNFSAPIPGNHGVYVSPGGWIEQSAPEVANRAKAKRAELTSGCGVGVGNAIFDGRNYLRSSDAPNLLPGHYIMSADSRFVLVLQSYGNLVQYGPCYTKMWASNTDGQNVSHLAMQPDGNLVLRGPNNEVRWQSGSGGGPGHITIQDDGNAVIYSDPSGIARWQSQTTFGGLMSYTGSDHRSPNEYLYSNMYIKSPDGRYILVMQPDGNLVLYGPGGHLLWNAGTNGAGNYLVMQPDGNLVVRSPGGAALWHTTMNGGQLAPGGHVRVQSDGNLVVYKTSGTSAWNAGTAGRT